MKICRPIDATLAMLNRVYQAGGLNFIQKIDYLLEVVVRIALIVAFVVVVASLNTTRNRPQSISKPLFGSRLITGHKTTPSVSHYC